MKTLRNCLSIPLATFLCMMQQQVFAQLKADFSASVTEGCTPLVVQFNDLSTGGAVKWEWDLGNGNTSPLQSPGAIYITPGTYTIKLIVTDAAQQQDSIIKTTYIDVYPNPEVNFSAIPVSGCAPLTVKFTDLSTTPSGNINSWAWDFGDGNSSSIQNPSNIYTISNSFSIALTVTNNFGCKKTLQKADVISIFPTATADFSYTYNDLCQVPATVNFLNSSSSTSSLSYQWFFGDGSTSTLVNPTHNYTTSGNFNIKLIVQNRSGCTDTITKPISIGLVKPDFLLVSGCLNTGYEFKDNSTPAALSATWDFGDGGIGTGLALNHLYGATGNYQVVMSANFGSCTKTVSKIINIAERAVPDFNANGDVSACSVPATVRFNNNSVGGVTYQWNFGDGTTSTAANPSHSYTQFGTYTVTLIAFNANGCPDTIRKKNIITLKAPEIIGFQNLPVKGCSPQIVNFKANINSPDQVTNYLWRFGDGTTSTDSTPSHTYTNIGSYDIRLIITTEGGCTDTLLLTQAVQVSRRPTANFTATPLDVCASTEIQFTDLSSGNANEWVWIFGDGSSSREQNPLHKYIDTGSFTVTLYARNNGCEDSATFSYIHISPPIANFSFDTTCSSPYTKTFVDKSIDPRTWRWNFGDGVTSTAQNPSHTFRATGEFNVTLIVTNGSCADTTMMPVLIVNESPLFDYVSLNPGFCKNDSIRFTASNFDSTKIRSLYWDFGDNSTSVDSTLADSVIIHRYLQAGTYTPLLIVTNNLGCNDTISKPVNIQINGPSAVFINNPDACVNSLVEFSDQSFTDIGHSLTNWTWDFGDGTVQTFGRPAFTHTYTRGGTFDVKLALLDNSGCSDTILHIAAITIGDPKADFGVANPVSCDLSPVNFLDSSIGDSLNYYWDFGDGSSVTDSMPSHFFPGPGNYVVTLTVTDKYGCADTISKADPITISNPEAAFILDDSLTLCPPLVIQPQNSSQNFTSSLWDFGDGNSSSYNDPLHTYTTNGNFLLTLIVKGYGECYDTSSKPIFINAPTGTMQYHPFESCLPLAVSFNATATTTSKSTFVWDYGNGITQTSLDPSITYTYNEPGVFIPKLIIIDSGGCRIPIENPDTIRVSGALAKFEASVLPACDSSLAIFSDSIVTAFDKLAAFSWNLGDGTILDSINNPLHYYKLSGNYKVSLSTTTENGCENVYTVTVPAQVNVSPVLSLAANDSVCQASTVNFAVTNSADRAGNLQWLWNFGNGETSTLQYPVYSYEKAGTYKVGVNAVSQFGCKDTSMQTVAVLPIPSVDAGTGVTLCLGQSATLQASGANHYVWDFDPSISCVACREPDVRPQTSTTYLVTGNSYGCEATDTVSVQVIQPSQISASNPAAICIGDSVQLSASGTQVYNWQPSTGLNNPNISNPVAKPSSTTIYSAVGSDSLGCFSNSVNVTVEVTPYPTFDITDSVAQIFSGSGYQIATTNSLDVNSWQWSPQDGLSCFNCPQPYAKPLNNITYTAEAFNSTGCSVSDRITIQVLCKNENMFIPNTFSPNGDGMNDVFYVRGKGLFSIKSLRIFNRWGQLVFEKTDLQPNNAAYGWNGTYLGRSQQPDVYVYVIEVICDSGVKLFQKGNVTLIR